MTQVVPGSLMLLRVSIYRMDFAISNFFYIVIILRQQHVHRVHTLTQSDLKTLNYESKKMKLTD